MRKLVKELVHAAAKAGGHVATPSPEADQCLEEACGHRLTTGADHSPDTGAR
jgi:hypothetical protein